MKTPVVKIKCMLVLPALMIVGLLHNRADAGAWNEIGRHLGLGWSNGYHAYNSCDWYGPAYYGGCTPKPVPGYPHPEWQSMPAGNPASWEFQSRQITPRPTAARSYRAWPTR